MSSNQSPKKGGNPENDALEPASKRQRLDQDKDKAIKASDSADEAAEEDFQDSQENEDSFDDDFGEEAEEEGEPHGEDDFDLEKYKKWRAEHPDEELPEDMLLGDDSEEGEAEMAEDEMEEGEEKQENSSDSN